MIYSKSLCEKYFNLFSDCQFKKDKLHQIDFIVTKIMAHRLKYLKVEEETNVPWYVVAVIHALEAGLKFNSHLHNGDPLTDRTIRVPSGRPKEGTPPFTWEESAIDALVYEEFDTWEDWSIEGILYKLEGYNGWGYAEYHDINSPYLWSFSNHYQRGKYTSDGKFDREAVSNQCGAAVLIKRMVEKGFIEIYHSFLINPPKFRYADEIIPEADILQKFLNQYLEYPMKLQVDGWPGKKTSDAFKELTGYYLKGDPRKY